MEDADRRLTLQLFQQWQQACGISLPPVNIFKRAAAMGLWPNCLLVAVEREPKLAYKCEHMGSVIAEVYGHDLTGEYVPEDVTKFPGAVMFSRLGELLADQRPIEDAGEIGDKDGKIIKYRICLLPYGDDGSKSLSHILIGLSFREF